MTEEEDFIIIYKKYKAKYGDNAFRYLSAMLEEMKKIHARNFKGKDLGQSWKSKKGSYIEKIIQYILTPLIEEIGFSIINGNKLKPASLPEDLDLVKRNLLIDYGKFGSHLPDVDMAIFNPVDKKVVAILSSKATFRERMAQPAYWKLKLAAGSVTKHI